MKNWSYILLAAVLAFLSGCAKVETAPAPAAQVSFSVGSYSARTKVSSLGDEGIASFRSRAFLHATGVAETQDFFGVEGETITYQAPEWLPSHPYYWPKDDASYINFVSWYDPAGNPTSLSETSLKWTERAIAPTDNIMYADEAWRFNGNKQVYTAVSGVSEGVPTLFHHALARLNFTAIAKQLSATDGTTWEVQVDAITVNGAFGTGTLTLTNSDPGTAETTKAWTTTGWTAKAGSQVTIQATGGPWTLTSREAGQDPVALISNYTVLPQTVTDNIALTIAYSVTTRYSASEYIKESTSATVKLNSFVSTIDAWEMNKIITYNIVIDPATDTIKFDPEMRNWEDISSVPDLVIE